MGLCLMVHSFISFSYGYALFWDFACYLCCLFELFMVLLGFFISKVWTIRPRGVVTKLSSYRLWISLIPSSRIPMRGVRFTVLWFFLCSASKFLFFIFIFCLLSICCSVPLVWMYDIANGLVFGTGEVWL